MKHHKKIKLSSLIDHIIKLSGAEHEDFMSDSSTHKEVIEKTIKFLVEFDLISDKIDLGKG